jgi:hypothetical protein
MSVSGMLAMKEQFPHLRNGRPWRQKDIDDIEILRGLAAEEGADGRSSGVACDRFATRDPATAPRHRRL